MLFIHGLLWSARGWIPCREQPLGIDGPSNPPQNCTELLLAADGQPLKDCH